MAPKDESHSQSQQYSFIVSRLILKIEISDVYTTKEDHFVLKIYILQRCHIFNSFNRNKEFTLRWLNYISVIIDPV